MASIKFEIYMPLASTDIVVDSSSVQYHDPREYDEATYKRRDQSSYILNIIGKIF